MEVHRSGRSRVFRLGDRSTGKLYSLQDLEHAIDWVRHGQFPSYVRVGWWVIRRFIEHPRLQIVVPIATISSPHVFTARAFRREGVELLQRVIEAISAGSLSLSASESDIDHTIDVEDLGFLLDAYDHGRARGFYTMVGYVY